MNVVQLGAKVLLAMHVTLIVVLGEDVKVCIWQTAGVSAVMTTVIQSGGYSA